MPTQDTMQEASVHIENVGGIDTTQIRLSPGVTILTGRNATNRTSFLRAVMGALGSRDVSLRAGTDSGRVELELEGASYDRSLKQTESGVTMEGDPYLSDPTLADLFAFLLRSNPARQAIVQGTDLREVILEPVDTESIQREIVRLEDRRRELDRELEELDTMESRLPQLEREKADLETEIRKKRVELEEIQATINDLADGADANRSEPEQLGQLRDARQELSDVRRRINTERESIAAIREERAEVREALEAFDGDGPTKPADIDREIESLRERKHSLESTVSQLQQVHQFNDNVLDNGNHPFDPPRPEGSGENPTDQLVSDDLIECWTCGSTTERDAFESTQVRLQNLIDEHRQEKNAVESRLSTLIEKRESVEETRRERRRLNRRLGDLQAELDDRQRRLDGLETEQTELKSTIESLESAVADEGTSGYEELVERHQKAYELEFELEQYRENRDDIDEEIRAIEADLDRREALEEEWETVQSELLSQRSKVERVESEAVEAFNDEMQQVLDKLGYDNIARIWIERISDGDGTDDARFELNIVRETDGVVHRDQIDHLSESEREVTGLVFALAGYLVHDVHETVPFILLDSLEAIDAERIGRLVDHFENYARYLIVALLPEDASELDEGHQRISDI